MAYQIGPCVHYASVWSASQKWIARANCNVMATATHELHLMPIQKAVSWCVAFYYILRLLVMILCFHSMAAPRIEAYRPARFVIIITIMFFLLCRVLYYMDWTVRLSVRCNPYFVLHPGI